MTEDKYANKRLIDAKKHVELRQKVLVYMMDELKLEPLELLNITADALAYLIIEGCEGDKKRVEELCDVMFRDIKHNLLEACDNPEFMPEPSKLKTDEPTEKLK